jgi:hypothetical protein
LENAVSALCAPVLWITVERAVAGGRACRDYEVCAEDGQTLLDARAFNWGRDIVVQAGDPAKPCLVLRRRRSFPITGRVDLLEMPAGRRIGVLSRSGRFHDAEGRLAGRFQDARSAGSRTREGLIVGLLDAAFGGDGTQSDISSPSGFLYTLGGAQAGTLSRARLPFSTEAMDQPKSARSLVRFLPKRLTDALRAPSTPKGWRLERTSIPPREDPRLSIAAALFAIELSHW